MNVCFYAPPGQISEALRRCAHGALSSPIVDLNDAPLLAWKEKLTAADLVLIDITAANATACYVAGMADALQKRIILLSPLDDTVPVVFDKHRVIVHRWNLELLRAELEKFAAPSSAEDPTNDDTPAGKFHQLFGDILRVHGYIHRGPVEFDGSSFTLREQDMDLSLVQEIAHRAKSLNLRVRLL